MSKPARILFIVLLLAVTVVPSVGTQAGKAEGLTPETIEKLEKSFELTPEKRALMNAITNNDVKDLAFNRERFI
ncbi:MAG: hypothetical protein JSV33_15665, partial [bacterium]